MEKLILVHYVNVGNMSMSDWAVYKQSMMDALPKDDGIINYIIPIRGETKVECLNPRLVSEEEYAKAAEVLKRNQKIVDDLVAKFRNK